MNTPIEPCMTCLHGRVDPYNARRYRCLGAPGSYEDHLQAAVDIAGMRPRPAIAEQIGLEVHQEGINGGQVLWPITFVPVWIKACGKYEPMRRIEGADL